MTQQRIPITRQYNRVTPSGESSDYFELRDVPELAKYEPFDRMQILNTSTANGIQVNLNGDANGFPVLPQGVIIVENPKVWAVRISFETALRADTTTPFTFTTDA